MTEEYRYARLTWPEMNDAIAAQKVVLLPLGSTEQHGPHLPLETDAYLAEQVCLAAASRAADRALVLPPVSFGLNMHHMDFPGTVHIQPQVFIDFVLNITKSVAYHGFEKILLVNGHGSNGPLADVAARRTTLETGSLCAAVGYMSLAAEAFEAIRETKTWAHADEFETSIYLHLAPERVRWDQVVAGDDVTGQFLSSDSTSEFPVRFSDYWGRWTQVGVHGDPTAATAAKGRILFEAAVAGMVGLIDEWRAWPVAERSDQHRGPVQKDVRW